MTLPVRGTARGAVGFRAFLFAAAAIAIEVPSPARAQQVDPFPAEAGAPSKTRAHKPDFSPAEDVTGESDQELGRKLQQVLRVHGADIYGCYGVALGEHPGLTGEVLVRMSVLPGGAVERAEILKDEAGSKRLADCLTGSMRTWRVEEIAGTTKDQFVFPLVFKPEAATEATRVVEKPLRYVVSLAEGKPGPLGQGRVEARVLIDSRTVGETAASLTHLTLHPFARLSLHTHPQATEVFYVIKGMARVRDAAGGLTVANAGDVIALPAKVPHNIESAPLAPLSLLQFFAPGGPERAYRDPRDRAGTMPAAKVRAVPKNAVNALRVIKGSDAHDAAVDGHGLSALLLDGSKNDTPSLARIEAASGSELALPAGEAFDEIIYVLGGRAELLINGMVLPLGQGDAVHVPAGTPRTIKVSERLNAVMFHTPSATTPPAATPPVQPEKK